MAGASGSEHARLLEQARPDGSRAVVSTRHGRHHRRGITGRDLVRGYDCTPMPALVPTIVPAATPDISIVDTVDTVDRLPRLIDHEGELDEASPHLLMF